MGQKGLGTKVGWESRGYKKMEITKRIEFQLMNCDENYIKNSCLWFPASFLPPFHLFITKKCIPIIEIATQEKKGLYMIFRMKCYHVTSNKKM